MKAINKTTSFILITFILSYSMIALFYFLGGELNSLTGTVVAILYMFIPALSVIIVEKLIHKQKIIKPLGISFRLNKWYWIAILFPLVTGLLAIPISLLFSNVSYSPEMEGMFARFRDVMTPEEIEQMKNSFEKLPLHPFWISIAQGLIAGVTINAVAAFGEELGWRGFLVKQFGKMTFLKASLIIGIIWGIWHAPLILLGHNYPEHSQFGVLMMTFWCILLTPSFIYVRIKANSVIAAAVIHGTINGTAGIAIMLIKGGNDVLVGITGLAGFIALLIVTALIFVYDRWISRDHIMTSKLNLNMS